MSCGFRPVTPDIQHFYHESSGTLSYVVSDPNSGVAAVVDPVLGFSIVSGRTNSAHVDAIVEFVQSQDLSVEWILETHAHADHLSGARRVQERLGGKIAIGEGIRSVQQYFGAVFNLQAPFVADGHQFDHLFADGSEFQLGTLDCRVLHTPGHTEDSITYLIGDCAFVGDSLFMTDFGTARCDFPGGDAGRLYDSIQTLFSLPDNTALYMCHDYPPESRELCFVTTVAEQKAHNKHVGGSVSKEDFVAMREARDATLTLPALILPSIQVNICAGQLPAAEDNDIAYIRIPLDTL